MSTVSCILLYANFKRVTNGLEVLHGGTFKIEGSIVTTMMFLIVF
ncbi:hypothetical protein [Bacillus cereus]|nr:hypothetical protein [Bacillus cereus]MDA2135439.1 hypothetical protein [Bacillus cereus]